MDDLSWTTIALGLFVLLVLDHLLIRRPRERRALAALAESKGARLKPQTRHPQIDPGRCIGCASCIAVCPETHGAVSPLGIVDGRAALVQPQLCVGHAVCEEACPVDAIRVTLGELAGDPRIPALAPTQESAVPGIYVAGELSGVPLIKNAIAQGKEAIAAIAKRCADEPAAATDDEAPHNVVIVGLGPGGFAAALAAHDLGLRYLAIDMRALGGTVANYPRRKLVLTSPVDLPLYGAFKKREITKEELLGIWTSTAERYGLSTRLGERVTAIEGERDAFTVRTDAGAYPARHVLLALGRRGTPRQLGVPGEERTKVAYGLLDAAQIQGQRVLVVGGGDSAVEAACVLGRYAGNDVSISYRRDKFARVKPKNREKIEAAIASGAVTAYLPSTVTRVDDDTVTLDRGGEERVIPNDLVFVLIGGEPPYPFLCEVGVLPPEAMARR